MSDIRCSVVVRKELEQLGRVKEAMKYFRNASSIGYKGDIEEDVKELAYELEYLIENGTFTDEEHGYVLPEDLAESGLEVEEIGDKI